MGDCESILKEMNGISQDSSLIIFKYEKKNVSANEKYIQYEVYDPNTYNKLDLSVCEDNINIYVPVVNKYIMK